MPKLCDIVKPGVPCKVKRFTCNYPIKWSGHNLYHVNGDEYIHGEAVLFADDWELVTEPTVESVLRERGYYGDTFNGGQYYAINRGVTEFRCDTTKRPTTPEQAKAICDLLDGYR